MEWVKPEMDTTEIIISYRQAKDKINQINILADLTRSDLETILEVLKDAGEDTTEAEKRFKRCKWCGLLYFGENGADDHKKCDTLRRYHMRKGA